jgi:hypothetical protein
MTTSATTKRIDRLHSKNPTDAAWRAQQAQVDSDIEGLHRDRDLDQLKVEMDAAGIGPRERIKRLKAYIRRRVLG